MDKNTYTFIIYIIQAYQFNPREDFLNVNICMNEQSLNRLHGFCETLSNNKAYILKRALFLITWHKAITCMKFNHDTLDYADFGQTMPGPICKGFYVSYFTKQLNIFLILIRQLVRYLRFLSRPNATHTLVSGFYVVSATLVN